MKKIILTSFILIMVSSNSFSIDWQKVDKRVKQTGAAIIVADKIHEEIDPQRKEAKEKKKKEVAKKAQADNSELESKVAAVFMAASGQQPSAPDTFAASYLYTLKQRYAADYKARYKSLAKNRETEARFRQVYDDATMRQIMGLSSKDAVKQAMDQRYPMLF